MKSGFARLDYDDVWFPNLSLSAELVREALPAADVVTAGAMLDSRPDPRPNATRTAVDGRALFLAILLIDEIRA
jgi:hypothetical protein